jgi:hypothetical protein
MTSDLPHEFSVRSTMYSEVLMLEKVMYNQLCEVSSKAHTPPLLL